MADRILDNKSMWKIVIQHAWQATQSAEDSRELAIKRREAEALETERCEADEREEAARIKAEAATAEADRNRLLAEVAAAKASADIIRKALNIIYSLI